MARVLLSPRGRHLAHGCRNQQDFRTCPSVFPSQRHSNPFNTVVWVRESGYKLKGEVQTVYKEKLSPHEDSQAVGQVAQRGCAVPIPAGCQNPSGYSSEQPALSRRLDLGKAFPA